VRRHNITINNKKKREEDPNWRKYEQNDSGFNLECDFIIASSLYLNSKAFIKKRIVSSL